MAAIVLALGTCAGPRAWSLAQDNQTRESFLRNVDAALTARDPNTLLALSNVQAWREAGYPPPEQLTMILPEGPITRVRDLSESDVLYKDGQGRQWRLSLERDAQGKSWKVILHDRSCPRSGGMARAPQWDTRSPAHEGASTWTPLECWPLPQ